MQRVLDLTLSASALIALAPLIGLIAAALRITLGAGPIFAQARPGLDERTFTLYKFRTMTEARDGRRVAP